MNNEQRRDVRVVARNLVPSSPCPLLPREKGVKSLSEWERAKLAQVFPRIRRGGAICPGDRHLSPL